MVVQIFNSGVVSGPETLVLPAAHLFRESHVCVFLVEKRWGDKGLVPLQYARSLGLSVEAVEVSSRLDFTALRRLRALLRRLAPRVVHAHDVKATTYAWLASRGESWNCISTHHGVGGRPDRKTKAYEYFYSQFILPRMRRAITVSHDDESTLRRRGLDPAKIVFVPNGITRPLWSAASRVAEKARLRTEWAKSLPNFDPQAVVIGIVARLSEEKRHSYLLRVLSDLERTRRGNHWCLIAVGSGALEARLKRETAELGLEKKVHWLGYCANASSLMPGFDLLAFTSSAEGLPIAALEAGWAGTPIFSSNVGALPELIEPDGGIVFPREQDSSHTAIALAGLIGNPPLLTQMGQRLQQRVITDFSAEAWVGRMEAIYRSV